MKNPASFKRVRSGNDTRELILAEAVELFHTQGFVKASTRKLAKNIGLTSSSIYNHFINKEAILFTIIQRAGEKVLATLAEAIENYDDPRECLKQMITGMLSLFRVNAMKKEIAIFIDELYQLPQNYRKLCNQQHRMIFDLFRDKISEMEKKNLINPVNPTVATFGILGAILWVYHWFKEDGSLSIEEIADEMCRNLLFDGLMAKTFSSPPTNRK